MGIYAFVSMGYLFIGHSEGAIKGLSLPFLVCPRELLIGRKIRDLTTDVVRVS